MPPGCLPLFLPSLFLLACLSPFLFVFFPPSALAACLTPHCLPFADVLQSRLPLARLPTPYLVSDLCCQRVVVVEVTGALKTKGVQLVDNLHQECVKHALNRPCCLACLTICPNVLKQTTI